MLINFQQLSIGLISIVWLCFFINWGILCPPNSGLHPENDVARISYVETLARNVYHLDIFGWGIARGNFLLSCVWLGYMIIRNLLATLTQPIKNLHTATPFDAGTGCRRISLVFLQRG